MKKAEGRMKKELNCSSRGLIVGLTGGIACGKTAVANLLAQHGADIIDLDKMGHELLLKGSPVYEQIVKVFGVEILDESGGISRLKLGKVVFNDSEKLHQLNQITHPPIIEQSLSEAHRLAELGKERVVVIDAPLLIERGLQGMMDVVVVVVSDENTQLERIIKRSIEQKRPLNKEDAMARIHSQMPLSEKIKHADIVVENNESLIELEEKVIRLWEDLKKYQGHQKLKVRKN